MTIATTAALKLLLLAPAGGEQASVELDLQNLRNSRGVLQLCITANAAVFPDCGRDPQAIKRSFPASTRKLAIAAIPPGHYAITLFHDENVNRKLDTMLGIPREGFGFSRSPVVRFGAPKFNQVGIDLKAGINRQVIKLQYLL
jgi:uncharacterized protein (DUF2141 family)